MTIKTRKNQHLNLCLNKDFDQKSNYWAKYKLVSSSLPELDLKDIQTTTNFLGYVINAPILISSMIGGTLESGKILKKLAQGAEKMKLPLGLGSQRILLEDPSTEQYFMVRELAPSIPIIANIGAVQLNYGLDITDCQKIVEIVQADALCLHLNPLQEAIQLEGNTNFKNLVSKIQYLVQSLDIPIIIKEVGMGLNPQNIAKLYQAGIKIIDINGQGGSSWAKIEGERSSNNYGEIFADFGLPTPWILKNCPKLDNLTLIAGGGIRSGLDIATAIAMGADLASLALPCLQAVDQSNEVFVTFLQKLVKELKIAMFCSGSGDLKKLKKCQIRALD